MASRIDPKDPTDPLEEKMREALVLAFAHKVELAAQKAGDLPQGWRKPVMVLRHLTDALGAISLGFLAANISILLVSVVVNLLLHL